MRRSRRSGEEDDIVSPTIGLRSLVPPSSSPRVDRHVPPGGGPQLSDGASENLPGLRATGGEAT
eukprot:CAMPEP_0113325336 /NCGR_PEP_ID=MMETSP0010_2-20120614/17681_1 /TAXON_ID=216773 ORGANISM="Corethron hystrix, Strain 308" /NCGR_SAMPLE_ID=MMETSP0010_2 /ASSEMBLY_ACC=CAM_ASM_000155 /LENGTH=63 /DNA_ID=CAMNT_0000185089 /DNA_START=577 /DNA_END=765 /DNA_ORIENTATION=- /assembly_acc=CAM_ASM_000155